MYHYTYRITNKILNKHYYGVRTSKIHPKLDLGIKYFSSSCDKNFILDQKLNPTNYKYIIIRICNSRKEAGDLEIKLHEKFNVSANEHFYNKACHTSSGFTILGNQDAINKMVTTKAAKSPETKQQINSKISKIVKNLWKDEAYRKHQIDKKKGRPNTPEQRAKISASMKGVKKPDGFRIGLKHSIETKLKLSKSKIGYNNPSVKPITLFNDKGEPFLSILFKASEECRELNIPTSIVSTAKNNTTLYDHPMRKCDITKLTAEGKYKYKGYFAKYATTESNLANLSI